MNIIDRRLEPRREELRQPQRFLRRARAQVRRAVREASASSARSRMPARRGSLIPAGGVHEPHLRRSGARRRRATTCLPGNKKYIEGDSDRAPAAGRRRARQAPADSGEGEDEFRFALTDEEYLDLYLEDLELPDLAKRQVAGASSVQWRASRLFGRPARPRISVPRTLRHSMSRRIALKRPKAG
jgi:uncharacterized sporulation protein YeaH/YhbH (DUF444 family)